MDRRRLKILLIEDNPGDCVLVEDFLFEQIEAPVLTFADCFEMAKDVFATPDAVFDAVLLDITLPDKIGEDLIREIVSLSPDTPVIVLTGYADFEFSVRSFSLGAADYLLKDDLTSFALYKCIVYNMERKKIMTELEYSEKRYSELFHLSPLPMWVYDMVTLNFLDVNDAAVVHYGYTREEFLTFSITDIRPPAEVPRLFETLEMYKNLQLSRPGVFVHQKKNGELINVDIQSNQCVYNGRQAKIILIVDVTERVQYINAIEEQNKRLKEISWLQSHIIRAPLSRIMGLIPLVTDPLVTAEDRNLMFDFLKNSADELDTVIKEITVKSNSDIIKQYYPQFFEK